MNEKKYLQEIEEVIQAGPYHDNWESLSAYQAPKWYQDAKFGIFIHWGAYTVPEFGSEWYPRNMYQQGSREFEHHIKTYGHHKEFGYKDLIPLFKAEKFDPEEWMDLFQYAGAKYLVPVAEHHDGFQMYASELSHWNAAEMGPCRNVLKELHQAAEKRGIVPGASSHRIEHWFFLDGGRKFDSDIQGEYEKGHLYWPTMEGPKPDEFEKPDSDCQPSEEYMNDWLLRCCELVDRYRPKVFYFDWWIQQKAMKPWVQKFAAYYYNRAAQWGEEVAINYKYDAFMFGSAVPDVERGQFAQARPYFWQTDTAIARNSWSYTKGNDYKSANSILCDLLDVVSKNGTMLLNVGPRADGTIGPEDRKVLTEIGDWMQANGEAIFGTRVWRTSAEGPTEVKDGAFTDGEEKAFTSEDFRFTVKGNSLYAAVLRYPEDGVVRIRSLAGKGDAHQHHFNGFLRKISVLGFEEEPVWSREDDALVIRTETVHSDKPVVFRIEMK